MREPLPLYCLTSAAYAEAAASGAEPLDAAQTAWASTWGFDREDRDAEHQLVLGGVLALAQLSQTPPRSDEAGVGWDDTEPTRFGRYARRMWAALLAREQVSTA
jgi:exodeoxyribonuclease V gamma subunit